MIETVSESDAAGDNMLRLVFHTGELMNQMTLDEVRANAALPQTESV